MQADIIEKAANYAKGAMGRPQVGKIFFVDGASGDDNNPGNKPECPILKVETALDLCTDGKHDYIFVVDYWDGDTMPITVDATTVHIIGLGNLLFGPMSMAWPAMQGGAEACFELTGASNYCELPKTLSSTSPLFRSPVVMLIPSCVTIWEPSEL